MKILIFENNESDIKRLKTCISNFFNKYQLEYSVDSSSNKEYLFSSINEYDLLFLDISIGDENGINLGLELRDRNVECKIIILSNHPDYVFEGYKIKAERYFIKPIKQIEFDIEMETIIKNYLKNNMGIMDKKLCYKKIYFKDILYIDYYDRKTRIHLLNGKIINTTYTVKYWLDILKNQPFGQSHKAFLVNFNYISEIKTNEIKLINDETVSLSRHHKKSFEQDFLCCMHDLI